MDVSHFMTECTVFDLCTMCISCTSIEKQTVTYKLKQSQNYELKEDGDLILNCPVTVH